MTTTAELGGAPAITSYALYYAAGPTYTYVEWTGFSSQVTSVSRTVTGLTPNTQYKFKVISQNIHGWATLYSPESTATQTLTTFPDAVTNVQVILRTATNLGVDISWNAYVDNGLSVD